MDRIHYRLHVIDWTTGHVVKNHSKRDSDDCRKLLLLGENLDKNTWLKNKTYSAVLSCTAYPFLIESDDVLEVMFESVCLSTGFSHNYILLCIFCPKI